MTSVSVHHLTDLRPVGLTSVLVHHLTDLRLVELTGVSVHHLTDLQRSVDLTSILVKICLPLAVDQM